MQELRDITEERDILKKTYDHLLNGKLKKFRFMKKYKEMIDAIRNVQQENSYRTGSPRFLTAKDAESAECSR